MTVRRLILGITPGYNASEMRRQEVVRLQHITYQAFQKKGIDLAPLEIEKGADGLTYFCTPRGARIIGWAGVDGIHYCFIRGFGEMVFSVSPMNLAPHYVHPLASNFSDFLRLLLACGNSAALEQAWQWDREQFETFLRENPATKEQNTVLAQITEKTGLGPMENPWQYLRELQASFDYSKIKYTEDFYDLDMNPDAPQQTPKWEVYFEGSFWGCCNRTRPGKEVVIQKEFKWAGHHWLIPSVYVCGKGLVVDFCMRVEPSDIRAFMEKWDLSLENEESREFSEDERMRMELDDPMWLNFDSVLWLNGRELNQRSGCGISYNPCLPPETVDYESKLALDHYGLDTNFGWMICRYSYPWATKSPSKLRTLAVSMIQEKLPIPGPHFTVSRPGDTVTFSYRGQEHLLMVREYEAQTADINSTADAGTEYPEHYVAMTYTITPEPPDGVMTLTDCDDGDRPRQAPCAPDQPKVSSSAVVIGIIRGADGPASAFVGEKRGKLRAACSSLHFAPVEDVEWRIIFHEKQFEDMTLELIPS